MGTCHGQLAWEVVVNQGLSAHFAWELPKFSGRASEQKLTAQGFGLRPSFSFEPS